MPGSPDSIHALITNAKNAGEDAQRDALHSLIENIHHSQPSLKIAAAKGLSEFIVHVPDLEEDAINAAYDLCEDLHLSVRLQGYKTITAISEVLPRLIKHNADVLVQLLQTDEDEEVRCVKVALLRHLELDAAVTIGVFMDQIMSTGASPEPEDQQARDQLRTCAISFLTNDEISRSLLRTAETDESAQNVLLDGITDASCKIDFDEIRLLIDKILVQLPNASTCSVHLLENLVNAHLSNPTDTNNTRLDYLQSLVDSRLALPSHLLSILYFGRPMTFFKKLSPSVRLAYAYNAADLLSLLKTMDVPSTEKDVLREKTVILATLALPEILDSQGKNEPQHQKAAISYLSVLEDRKKYQPASHIPSNLSQILQRLSTTLSNTEDPQIQKIQNIIRSLVPIQTAQPPPSTTTTTTPITTGLKSTSQGLVTPQPTPASTFQSNGASLARPPISRAKRPSDTGQDQPVKRIRQEPAPSQPQELPALLKRIQTASSTTIGRGKDKEKEKDAVMMDIGDSLPSQQHSHRATPTGKKEKAPKTQAQPQVQQKEKEKAKAKEDMSVGLSIKGAAVREHKQQESAEQTPSLASRISGLGIGSASAGTGADINIAGAAGQRQFNRRGARKGRG